jgi:hypothetical protein
VLLGTVGAVSLLLLEKFLDKIIWNLHVTSASQN